MNKLKKGKNVCKELSLWTLLSLQYGQPLPLDLSATLLFHSWPFSHCHHIFLLDPSVTSSGVSLPFFVGCHSLANWGFLVAKDVSLATRLPEQYGQPLPFDLLQTTASHSWPLLHCHHTFLLDPSVTSSGVILPFFVGCHSLANWDSW